MISNIKQEIQCLLSYLYGSCPRTLSSRFKASSPVIGNAILRSGPKTDNRSSYFSFFSTGGFFLCKQSFTPFQNDLDFCRIIVTFSRKDGIALAFHQTIKSPSLWNNKEIHHAMNINIFYNYKVQRRNCLKSRFQFQRIFYFKGKWHEEHRKKIRLTEYIPMTPTRW